MTDYLGEMELSAMADMGRDPWMDASDVGGSQLRKNNLEGLYLHVILPVFESLEEE